MISAHVSPPAAPLPGTPLALPPISPIYLPPLRSGSSIRPTATGRPPRRLADIMTRRVITARCDQTVAELTRLLIRHRIGGVPVLNAEGGLAGVITQSDLATGLGLSEDTEIDKLMAGSVWFATPDASLDETADLMLAHNIHRVVVVDGDDVVGIVSSLDLLRAYRFYR